MTRLPSFPKIDLTSFDLNKLRSIELPFDLPKFDLPKFDLPFDLPKFDLPKFDIPVIDIAKMDDRVVETAKNAAYFTVGLAAAAVQRIAKLAA
jgi:hypothetical protein